MQLAEIKQASIYKEGTAHIPYQTGDYAYRIFKKEILKVCSKLAEQFNLEE